MQLVATLFHLYPRAPPAVMGLSRAFGPGKMSVLHKGGSVVYPTKSNLKGGGVARAYVEVIFGKWLS